MVAATAIALLALIPSLALGGPITKRYTNKVIRSYRTNQCLTTPPGVQIISGTLLQTGDCSTATRWDISPGSGSVTITGLNFALDAGVPQQNFNPGKVWQSYPGSPQQTWYLTNDNRIAVTGGNQCLDQGANGPQTYQCTTGNTNQIWYVEDPPNGPTSTTSASPSSTSSSAPSSSSAAPPTATGKQLKWATNPYICATVQGSYSGVGNGALVNFGKCLNPTAPDAATQVWNFMGNGLIQLAGTNYCLDAGVNPSNGVQMKVWQCYPGLAQQTWAFPATTGNYQTSNGQCLDLANQDYTTLQTWACSDYDVQQKFFMQ